MIPSVVAQQIRDTVLDYLRTTFSFSSDEFEKALFSFLEGDNGLFRGPYLDIKLPFRKASPNQRIPLDIKPEFTPYRHQLKAFQRLYSRDGHQPQHTLITTGTGSGKTECFLYPILDHCWRNQESRGVKAIILYPMNALATDQARRLANILWSDDRLKGKVTAGLYIGGAADHGVADKHHLVDKRDVLRASPPDILLTNYKMLDFLLLRPEDARLWQHNDADSLCYLVLDELHTYDGAQGSDVACLIRRLKNRLQTTPGALCCVGTSATIGGGDQADTISALTNFASKVFEEELFEDSVVIEDRQGPSEALGDDVDIDIVPVDASLEAIDPQYFDGIDEWIDKQLQLWLGDEGGGLSPVELGDRLSRHDFLRQVLRLLNGSLSDLDSLDQGLCKRVPDWEEIPSQNRLLLIDSFVSLVSRARRAVPTDEDPDRIEPFLAVQVHVWIRELRQLLRKVISATEIDFGWASELPMTQPGHQQWLPIAYCRECGSEGLATAQREGEPQLQTDLRVVGLAWLRRYGTARFITFGHGDGADMHPVFLDPKYLAISSDPRRADATGETISGIPIEIHADLSTGTPPRFLARCPECDTSQSLSMLGSRAPSLLSVMTSDLFLSQFNEDKKLLAFTDSVQDASHRAGFFSARTYRFNLRTAIQALLESEPGDLPLNGFSQRMMGFWEGQKGRQKLVATLWPADLAELPGYKRFLETGGAGQHKNLLDDLQVRLSWEVTMEYGLSVRAGRTLEITRCSTVSIDTEKLAAAAETLAVELAEETVLEGALPPALDQAAVSHYLAGFLHRLRTRGGIYHPLLKRYMEQRGNRFFLTKARQRLISPFGPASVLPRFVMDQAPRTDRDEVFDSLVSATNRKTWFRDWAAKSLGIQADDSGINQLYLHTVKRLDDAGVLTAASLVRRGSVWGIDPSALSLTRDLREVVCESCRHRVVLGADEATRWQDRACVRYRCVGRLGMSPDITETYYGRVYRSGRIERIFAAEHTGLLQRQDRERLEERFKDQRDPDAPNLLVATPTLEMGIDIGDLSATMMCSVPPTPANFLQRVGRAGRRTGNALGITLALNRPHDLYFHAAPAEMMSGQVLPPGCFLDAPEMLKRQMVAHAMDAWARSDVDAPAIPRNASFVLSGGNEKFPGRFIEFYRANREQITNDFMDRFQGPISDENKKKLLEFASGDKIPELIRNAFERVKTERQELRALQKKIRDRRAEIERDPDLSDDPEIDIHELRQSAGVLGRLIEELGSKYPLNVLTDEGVLPNYAFPEPGVRLESVLRSENSAGQPEYETREFIRPASTAIRELAPFNTFYAEGRRVRIDEIDIGNRARPLTERWHFCPLCTYMERILDDDAGASDCPRCGSVDWADAGQIRTMVHFRRSRSLEGRIEATTVDDSDDRQEEHYQTVDLIDVGPENFNGARLIEDIPFGFELLKNLTLREVNFGKDSSVRRGLQIAGELIGEKAFSVCPTCGRVQDGNCIRHAAYCKNKPTEGNPEKTEQIYLYREVQSEAIRVLLPVSEVQLDEKRASFRAALNLGFRRHFQGDPGHLQFKTLREPSPGTRMYRQFLVIFDAVPGGTGYLSELWQQNNFVKVLELALKALQACECQRDPEKDGCYRCIYAFQSQRDLDKISSRLAQEMLRQILGQRDSLSEVRTLSEVSLATRVESELEEKFLRALESKAVSLDDADWKEQVKSGEVYWSLKLGQRMWEIRAQVDLGTNDGVDRSSRPDFMIYPADRDPTIKPIAVFCDGFEFHACPTKAQGRIWDDIDKRRAIIRSGRYACWSITWKDVVDFENPKSSEPPIVFEGLEPNNHGQLARSLDVHLDRKLAVSPTMLALFEYLRMPDPQEWAQFAVFYSLSALMGQTQMPVTTAESTASALKDKSEPFEPGPFALAEGDSAVLARWRNANSFSALLYCGAEALQQGRLDETRVVLRLYDTVEDRQHHEFESGWRALLHAWNLLQFQSNVDVVSTELILARESQAIPAADIQRVADAPRTELAADAQVHEILDLLSEPGRQIVLKISEEGLPLPTVDFELPTDGARVGPEPEFAWPAHRIALLSDRQLEDLGEFEAAGWAVFATQSAVASEVIALLRERMAD